MLANVDAPAAEASIQAIAPGVATVQNATITAPASSLMLSAVNPSVSAVIRADATIDAPAAAWMLMAVVCMVRILDTPLRSPYRVNINQSVGARASGLGGSTSATPDSPSEHFASEENPRAKAEAEDARMGITLKDVKTEVAIHDL